MNLGPLDRFIDGLEHSWVCPNGAAATGPLTQEALSLLLRREQIKWWDPHLESQGRIRCYATDGGDEHLVRVTEADLEQMERAGIPRRPLPDPIGDGTSGRPSTHRG